MDNHQATCDCSHCIPPQELLHHPSIVGKWETKADLAALRREQELRAVTHLKEIVDSYKSPTPQMRSASINDETKEIVNGIFQRRKELTKVFNIGEVQLILAFWCYQKNQRSVPSVMLCMFLQEVMEPHAPKSFKTEKVQKDINGRKRAAGSDGKSALMIKKKTVDLLFKHGVFDILNELFHKNPHGVFRFEYGCATFYPSDSEIKLGDKRSYHSATVEEFNDLDVDIEVAANIGAVDQKSLASMSNARSRTLRSVTISDSDDEAIGMPMSMPSSVTQMQPVVEHNPDEPALEERRKVLDKLSKGIPLHNSRPYNPYNPGGMEACLQNRVKHLESSMDRLQVDNRDTQSQIRDLQHQIEEFLLSARLGLRPSEAFED